MKMSKNSNGLTIKSATCFSLETEQIGLTMFVLYDNKLCDPKPQ